jgi:hypothetical protein
MVARSYVYIYIYIYTQSFAWKIYKNVKNWINYSSLLTDTEDARASPARGPDCPTALHFRGHCTYIITQYLKTIDNNIYMI